MDGLIRALERLLDPLKRRVLLMIGRGIIRLVDDAQGIQHMQIRGLADEVLGRVDRLQEYGFTSVPKPGAEVLFAAVGGDRSHSVVIGVEDRRYRLTGLQGGEVALYDDQGQVVHLRRDGIHVGGKNLFLETSGIARLRGKGVEIHAEEYYQLDVAGLGSRRTHKGGVDYHDDTYTTGAVITGEEHGLHQPALQSDHPQEES